MTELVTDIQKEFKRLSPKARKQAAKEVLMPAARHDLGAFMWYVMHEPGNPFKPLAHQLEWIEHLHDVTCRNLLFLCPPGVGKTNVISLCYIPWELGRNMHHRIALTCNQQRQANSISDTLRNIIETSSKYKEVFPHVLPDRERKWTTAEWYIKRKIKGIKDPSFFGFGDKGAIIGNRVNVHVLDDLNDEENTTSPTERERINNWVMRTLKSRLTKYNLTDYDEKTGEWIITDNEVAARRIWVMTRWHEKDLASIAESEGFRIVRMPALGYWEMRAGIIVPDRLEKPLQARFVDETENKGEKGDPKQVDGVCNFQGENESEGKTKVENDLDGVKNLMSSALGKSSSFNALDASGNPVTSEPGNLGTCNIENPEPENPEKAGLPYKIDIRDILLSENIRVGEYCDKAVHLGEQSLIIHGSSLSPRIRTREELLDIYDKDPLGFARMYQQQPTMPEGEIFKPEYWGYYQDPPPPAEIVMWLQSYDTATSKRQRADYTCGLTAALTNAGRIYLIHGFCEKLSAPEVVDRVKRDYFLIDRNVRHEILVEKKTAGIGIVQSLQAQTMLPIVGIVPTSDKVARANACVGIVASGRVLLPVHGGGWVDWFVKQLADFPASEHDDWVDTFTQLMNRLVEIDLVILKEALTDSLRGDSDSAELDAPIDWSTIAGVGPDDFGMEFIGWG